jgi:hypothetical protein
MSTHEPKFSAAALANIEETGADWSRDCERLRDGELTETELLGHCLDGADEDREHGWIDYVVAVAAFASQLTPTELAEERADRQMDQERDDRLTGDR